MINVFGLRKRVEHIGTRDVHVFSCARAHVTRNKYCVRSSNTCDERSAGVKFARTFSPCRTPIQPVRRIFTNACLTRPQTFYDIRAGVRQRTMLFVHTCASRKSVAAQERIGRRHGSGELLRNGERFVQIKINSSHRYF